MPGPRTRTGLPRCRYDRGVAGGLVSSATIGHREAELPNRERHWGEHTAHRPAHVVEREFANEGASQNRSGGMLALPYRPAPPRRR